MPVKIFSGNSTDASALETKINEWMGKIERGSVRQISASSGQAASQQIVIAVWYTETKDAN